MSLIDSFKTNVTLITETKLRGPDGNFIKSLVPQMSFDAAIVYSSSSVVKASDTTVEKKKYTVAVPQDIELKFGDMLKDEHGRLLMITGQMTANPPKCASVALRFREYSAEETWRDIEI